MSHLQSSTRSWSLWGVLLLIIPAMFVIGALAGHTPSWGRAGEPVCAAGLPGGSGSG
jgi:hypothetical protein